MRQQLASGSSLRRILPTTAEHDMAAEAVTACASTPPRRQRPPVPPHGRGRRRDRSAPDRCATPGRGRSGRGSDLPGDELPARSGHRLDRRPAIAWFLVEEGMRLKSPVGSVPSARASRVRAGAHLRPGRRRQSRVPAPAPRHSGGDRCNTVRFLSLQSAHSSPAIVCWPQAYWRCSRLADAFALVSSAAGVVRAGAAAVVFMAARPAAFHLLGDEGVEGGGAPARPQRPVIVLADVALLLGVEVQEVLAGRGGGPQGGLPAIDLGASRRASRSRSCGRTECRAASARRGSARGSPAAWLEIAAATAA